MTFSNRVRFLFTMLQRSSQDLLIFSIVLFVFFLAFGMAAFLSFSSDVSDFRSLGYSILNLMRYTVTDLDYESLRNSNRFLGNLYYVIWSILMILILANVFIAILSEAYATISTETDDEGDLLTKLKASVRQSLLIMKQNGLIRGVLKWVHTPTRKIFSKTDKNKDGQLSTSEIAAAMHIEKDKAQQLIKEFDDDGNRQLSMNEVNDLKSKLSPKLKEPRLEISNRPKSGKKVEEKLERIEKLLSQLKDEGDL